MLLILPNAAVRILTHHRGAQKMLKVSFLLVNREICYTALRKRKDFFLVTKDKRPSLEMNAGTMTTSVKPYKKKRPFY
jgi:hypothetical protein